MSDKKKEPVTGAKENTIWPIPKFKFRVTWGETIISFSEVTGLDTEAQIIEYRHKDSKIHNPIKMPGVQKFSNITMKRGVFGEKGNYYNWYSNIQLNATNKVRENVTVELLNEKGKATMMWILHNAWSTKITGTELKSNGNEAAIDTLEIAFETLEIKNLNPT